MTSNPDPPPLGRRFTFCRFHIITWLVLFGCVWVLWQAQWEHDNVHPHELDEVYLRGTDIRGHLLSGWPTFMVDCFYRPWANFFPPNPPPADDYEWHWPGVARNLAACGLLLAATGFLLERWLRARSRWQFQLSTMLKLTVAAAVVIAVLTNWGPFLGLSTDLSLGLRDSDSILFYTSFLSRIPWHLQIPLTLMLLATVYAAIELLLWLARRMRFKPQTNDT